MSKKRKLIDLETTIIERLTSQAKENKMQVKGYIEYICNLQAFNKTIKKIEF